MTVISINPMRCCVSNLHARLDDYVDENSCRGEIESFERNGQVVPAIGRRLLGRDHYDVEIICGARRLFAARHLNVPLLVELKELSDREAIIAMELENRVRKELSPYERAVAYQSWLAEGHFSSREELCKTLGVSPARLCRLLQVASLPTLIVQAFAKPTEIREVWGVELATLLADEATGDAMMAEASVLASQIPRLSGQETYRRLRATKSSSSAEHPHRAIRNESGAELFRICKGKSQVVVHLPVHVLTQQTLRDIEAAVRSAMLNESDSYLIDASEIDAARTH